MRRSRSPPGGLIGWRSESPCARAMPPRCPIPRARSTSSPGDPPIHVPDEEIFPFVTIDVDLAVPADMLVADSCGAVSAGQGARRLASRCASRLGRYVVKGGRLVEATEAEGGEGRIAGLPAHGARMAAWATTMAESARQGTEAWPGLRVPALFGMEWPQAYTSETITQPEWPQPAGFESHGRIVLIEEKAVVGRLRVQPISLVQASVAEELLQRRPIAVGDAELLAHLVEAVVASRLMSPGAVTAVIEMGRQPGEVAVSLMDPQAYAWKKWKSRLPAIVVALGAQLGEDRLATAINELLARTGEPATVRELFDILESDTGVSMSQTYDELIAGKAMPVLALVGVTFEGGRRGGDARTPYAVKGFVSNEGDGHSAVTLVLRTELDPVEISVSIGPHERSAFSMQARARPIVLLLDPRKTCFRWRPLNGAGMVEHVENPTHD